MQLTALAAQKVLACSSRAPLSGLQGPAREDEWQSVSVHEPFGGFFGVGRLVCVRFVVVVRIGVLFPHASQGF